MQERREVPGSRRGVSREQLDSLPWLRYDRMARAVTERLRVRVLPGQPFWVLAVRNPVHHTHYQVALPEYPAGEAQFCSCPDFARRGIGTCKHVEAAAAWLAAHPEIARPASVRAGAKTLWRQIDKARQGTAASNRPDSVRWRVAGRTLFETAPGRIGRVTKKGEGGKGSAGRRAERGVSSTSRALL